MTKTINYTDRGETAEFSDIIYSELKKSIKNIPVKIEKTEPLALIDYNKELQIKETALKKFLILHNIPVVPNPIIKSPMPRNYRTTSKRKIVESGNKFFLLFADEEYPSRDSLFRASLLEPVEHGKIYEYLTGFMNSTGNTFFARALNFIIIRGNYKEFTVIFNINRIDASIVRKIKSISEKIKDLNFNVISVFSYYDPTKSEYYFETERPEKEVSFKKFYGPDFLFLKNGTKKYSYHPTSFSQVNESIISSMVGKISEMLSPGAAQYFFDLYCGYGLFACQFAPLFKETIGIETAGESIKSAVINAKYLAPGSKVKFITKRITADSLRQSLQPVKGEEIFLLDPPRSGTENGVLKVIAERNPLKIIHIFCNTDDMPDELKEWNRNGYSVKSISPLDMFPGSPNLETIVLLERKPG